MCIVLLVCKCNGTHSTNKKQDYQCCSSRVPWWICVCNFNKRSCELVSLYDQEYIFCYFRYALNVWHLPIATLSFALVTAKLTSLVRETLMQKVPELLKNCRSTIWHSEVGVTALHCRAWTGLVQSASDTTVQIWFGRLESKYKRLITLHYTFYVIITSLLPI